MTSTETKTIDVMVIGNDGECEIDSDFDALREGQKEKVVLVFHFEDDSPWSERMLRIITIINGDKMYTARISGNSYEVPRHMLFEGELKFILRGFKTKDKLNIVLRNGHILVTDKIQEGDVLMDSDMRAQGHMFATDTIKGSKTHIKEDFYRHFIMTSKNASNKTHNVPMYKDDPDGYMQVSNHNDRIAIFGRQMVKTGTFGGKVWLS